MSVFASHTINPTTPCEGTVHLANEQREPVVLKVKLGYYRSRLTKNFFRQWDAWMLIEEDDEGKRALDKMVLLLIGWWNVLEAEGGPTIPLTAEALFPIDAVFLMELLSGLMQHFGTFIPGEVAGGMQKPASLNGTSHPKGKITSSRKR